MIPKHILEELLHGQDIDFEKLIPISDQYQLISLKIIQGKSKGYPEETIKQMGEEKMRIEQDLYFLISPEISHQ